MGFGNSDPRIYERVNLKGKLLRWSIEDHISLLAPITNNLPGMVWDVKQDKIVPVEPRIQMVDTPWCHMKHAPTKRCGMDHHILFNIYGIIPPRCMECWKVVVAPRTFHELVQLEHLQYALDKPSKCGIELRDYTPRFYGGYFYNNSLDEGLERYREVREAVDQAISPDIGVILKRACTEFEMIKGPSHQWHMTANDERIINLVEYYVNMNEIGHAQTDMSKYYVRLKWAMWAHMNGDKTYMEYNDGQPLWPDCLTYHDKPVDDMKHDLALGRAEGEFKINPELSDEFFKASLKWANENNVNPDALTNMLGGQYCNPLNLRGMVPLETIGEHDELT
jgi:hypothetical protein